uniref:Uncharacterized protein n=1 Tax=Melopsittacus undulatus TaxID=13146 RepID=A0A8C6NED3_MELUD
RGCPLWSWKSSPSSTMGFGSQRQVSPRVQGPRGASLPSAEAAGTAQLPRLWAQYRKTSHPSTMQMVIEALQAKDSKKGVSAVAIRRFILAKYPTVHPTLLKYWLKVTLSKALNRGDLVRPRNSTATGVTGTFMVSRGMLAPLHKVKGWWCHKERGCPDPRRGSCLGSSSAHPTGAVEEKRKVAKQKLRAKRMEVRMVQWRGGGGAAKPRSDGAKPPPAASRNRGPGKGRAGPSMAPAAEEAGGDSGDSPAGARAKGPRKTPVGKSKRKVPKGAQPRAPKGPEPGALKGPEPGALKGPEPGAPEGTQPEGTKVKGAEGKVRKPRGKTGASKGQASLKKTAAHPEGKKAS